MSLRSTALFAGLLSLIACGGNTVSKKPQPAQPGPTPVEETGHVGKPLDLDADADADASTPQQLFDEADSILVRMQNGEGSSSLLVHLQDLSRRAESLDEGERKTRFLRLLSMMQLIVRPMKDEAATHAELEAFVREVSGTRFDPEEGAATVGPSLSKELASLREL